MTIRILGIETSCDETAIGLVADGRMILANTVVSSLELHGPYGGVIPEIAARVHAETIATVLEKSLEEAHLNLDQVDAIAVTQGPGLPGALLIGLAFAKGLSLALKRPLIPVDHLAAHLYAGEMSDPSVVPPYIGLVVSGGHTLLCVVHPDCRYELLGETRDDAVGEAFDKVAKLLGLGYPGGPIIDRLSTEGSRLAVRFPRSHTQKPLDFSFSGLKTAVYQHTEKIRRSDLAHSTQHTEERKETSVADIAASFQEAAVDLLVSRTLRACQRTGIKQIVVGGGVASNQRLRERFSDAAKEGKWRVIFPPPPLCVDNGAMVAGIAFPLLRKGKIAELSVVSDPNLCLTKRST
ncbi:MAG: tRNA (adenosine(37)-N6)-threonylcarbamoyltransferase complex transferase subunit TsaD [Candidatus Omnitrophica bacterium]|nr:tRNA (adenosine(37)-N6)-threonylcarbamoyltransferase complex transferase subunit TsaD [Candidatus Omnitrophota bacterium]